MKKCGKAFTNPRAMSPHEATYRILGLPLHKSDFQVGWIPTGLPHQRVSHLKSTHLLSNLDDGEETSLSVE